MTPFGEGVGSYAPPVTEQNPSPSHPFRPLATGVVIAASIVIGLSLVLVAATFGRCDAFGGRCPADRPPLWDDDVFGMAAFGTALIVAVPLFLRRPSWRRLAVAASAGAGAALIVGLLVTNAAHG